MPTAARDGAPERRDSANVRPIWSSAQGGGSARPTTRIWQSRRTFPVNRFVAIQKVCWFHSHTTEECIVVAADRIAS